jgi:HEAT repeat protein
MKPHRDPKKPSVDTMLRWIVSTHRSRRARARHFLVTKPHYFSVGDVLKYLSHDDPVLRRGAIGALCEMHPSSDETANILRIAKSDSDKWVRYEACYAILRFDQGFDLDLLRETLIALLADTSWHVRYAALEVIKDLAVTDARVVKGVIQALGDSQWNVRSVAAKAIEACGVVNDEVINTLRLATTDNESRVRVSVAETLGGLPASDATAALLAALISDNDAHVQLAAISAAVRAGGCSLVVIPAIVSALRSPSSEVELAARSALLTIRGR